MLIESASKYYLKKVRAKAKMYEYGIVDKYHIEVESQANDLILLCIGVVGDIANEICNMSEKPIILPKDREEELYFVSRFFDSYFQSKMSIEMNPYYILMGAISYYFCNMNGSSKVMMSFMPEVSEFDFFASGLENVIMWLLDNNHEFEFDIIDERYRGEIIKLVEYYNAFFDCKKTDNTNFDDFRSCVYKKGNDREILFTDIILAILKKKIYNSCINLMPLYSSIDKNDWIPTFKNNKVMKEMWSSQLLLGKEGVFNGKSGVIQMPTSSGKTTSILLAIQAAFLSHRTSVVVVVAPFRALCKEIIFEIENFFEFDENILVTEFSDIPESSEIKLVESDLVRNKIFVMTPEKLEFILKYHTGIVENINMIIFDEAHLFDDESRGTDYELLLTTINRYLKPDAQKLLISAVISNAEQLNEWINNNGMVIKNNSIKTSEKVVAFNTFTSTDINNVQSNLHFVDPNKYLEEEFYVPRVVKTEVLNKKGNERKKRYFPDIENIKQDVGIYYAIKLIRNGSVAFFCSKKDTVNNILNRFIDLKERGILLDDFYKLSDSRECSKIAYLIGEHLGKHNLYIAAVNGILGHHSGVPNGVRIAEEYALKNSLVRCVVCTSTLAQGVNLPIKYLIVSSIYQSKQIIKVRDFHNLIGRTARAGKEIEGTIILTENIYKNSKEKYKLNKYIHLLNAENSEECSSNLLKLVRKIDLDNNKYLPINFLRKYISVRYNDNEEYLKIKNSILKRKEQGVEYGAEVFYKMNEIEHILVSLENFILSFTEVEDDSFEIIQSTYGYYLANDEEKEELKHIYMLVKSNINSLGINDKLLYKKCMLGMLKMRELSKSISDNIYEIVNSDFNVLISIIISNLKELEVCKIIPRFLEIESVYELLKLWIGGESYIQIWNYAKSKNILIKWGKKSKEISLEEIITLCDSDFGYASLTIIQAIIEVLNTKECSKNIQEELNDLIFRIRYGLPNKESVYVYELGFADSIISQKIVNEIRGYDCSTKKKTKSAIKNNREKLRKLLENYPSYFLNRLEKLR